MYRSRSPRCMDLPPSVPSFLSLSLSPSIGTCVCVCARMSECVHMRIRDVALGSCP